MFDVTVKYHYYYTDDFSISDVCLLLETLTNVSCDWSWIFLFCRHILCLLAFELNVKIHNKNKNKRFPLEKLFLKYLHEDQFRVQQCVTELMVLQKILQCHKETFLSKRMHKKHLTSKETFCFAKGSLWWKNGSSDYKK